MKTAFRAPGLRLAIVLGIALAAAFAPAAAQTTQPIFWGTDGRILSVARAGDVLYAAGQFTYIGPNTGGGVPLDPLSGAPVARYPRVAGIVRTAIADGAGGWFIGGEFAAVEGQPRSNLAHVLAGGTLAAWAPAIGLSDRSHTTSEVVAFGAVETLALRGNTLYVGGTFVEAGGDPARRYLVAVDTESGAFEPFDPHADGPVTALALHDGALYVGGKFGQIGGTFRSRLAALDLRTALATPWNPGADGTVMSFAFRARSVFIGGEFDHAGGAPRNSIAELVLDRNEATAWDAELTPLRRYIAHGNWVWPYVNALELRGRTLYAAGSFSGTHGVPRHALVALDVGTAQPTSFDAHIGAGYVRGLELLGNTIYIGGYFIDVGGATRPNAAAVDATSGAPLAWNPRAYGDVETLAASDGAVYAGGTFTTIHDWYAQNSLVAFDAITGQPLPWHPNPNGSVQRLLTDGSTLYAIGTFTSIDGQARGHLAAFDAASGALLPWSPWTTAVTADNPIRCAELIGNTLYVGGAFNQINGVPRSSLAAIDGTSGVILPWDPNVRRWDKQVSAMSALGNDLFVAGIFDSVGLQPRRDLAEIDGSTGLATSWDTQPGFYMWARIDGFPFFRSITATAERIYVGGWFFKLAGQERSFMAAFDQSGALTPFDARLRENKDWSVGQSPLPADMVRVGDALYVAGTFQRIGGEPRTNVAALDPVTGDALEWNPDAGWFPGYYQFFGAYDLDYSNGTLYVGGGFKRFGGYPCAGLGAAILEPAAVAKGMKQTLLASSGRASALSLAIDWARIGSDVHLRFVLPADAATSLEIFDLQGRRLAAPLENAARKSGAHEIALDTRGWKAGIYYARLTAGAQVATQKLLLLR